MLGCLLLLVSVMAQGQPTDCWVETAVADFADGTFVDTEATAVGDGEIRLEAGGYSDDFSDPGSAANWEPWPSSSEPTHTATWTVAGGVFTHPQAGNEIGSYHPCLVDDSFTPAGDFSFTVRQRFTNTAAVGVLGIIMGAQDSETYHFIQWVDTQAAVKLYRRVGASWTLIQESSFADPVRDQWYEFRLEMVGTTFNFYIDDVPVVTAADALYAPGRIGMMAHMGSVNECDDVVIEDPILVGNYVSDVHDLGLYGDLLTLSWLGSEPVNSSVTFETRSSQSGTFWSSWEALDGGGNIMSPDGQHVQYRINLATSDPASQPVVEQVELCYEETIPSDCWLQTSVADFAGCDLDQVAVTEDDGSGELRLVPSFYDIFGGTSLDPQWESESWGGGVYTPTVAGGVMTHVNPGGGGFVRTPAEHGLGTSVEALLKFDLGGNATAGYMYFGFAGEGLVPWVLFGTSSNGDQVYATLYDGSQENVPLGADLLNTWHVYKIVRTAAGVFEWYVDGALRHTNGTHTIPSDPLRIYFSASGPTPPSAFVAADWVRVNDYPVSPGTYTSCVHNSGQSSDWLDLLWSGSEPVGTVVGFETRSGDSLTPDGSWSAWEALSGSDIVSPGANYIQYRAQLSSTDASATPVVADVEICYSVVGPDEIPPEVLSVSPQDMTPDVPVGTDVTATFSESLDPVSVTGSTLTLTPQGGGPAVAATVSYNDGTWTAILDPDTALDYDTTYVAHISTGVQDVAGNPLAADYMWSFTTAVEQFCWLETTGAEFADGTLTDTEVIGHGDGAVRLTAGTSFFDHFEGTATGPEWEHFNFFGNPPEVTVAGSEVTAQNGSCIKTYAAYDHVTLEGLVTIGDGSNAHFGLATAVDALGEGVPDPHWMMFTARDGGFEIRTRMDDGLGNESGQIDEPVTGYTPGQPYYLKIVWYASDTVEFYIDDNLVGSHDRVFGADQMKIYLTSNIGQDGSADWVSLSGGHATSGTYVSSIYDAGVPGVWLDLTWSGSAVSGSSVGYETRSGDVAVIDPSWSAWEAVAGTSIASPDGRYVQYRATLTTPDATLSPLIETVQLCNEEGDCVGTPDAIEALAAVQVTTGNGPGQITAIQVSWPAVAAGRTVSLYRKGFGNHPEYDDDPDAGSEPPAPDDPDIALTQGWTPAGEFIGTEATDLPSTRDFWYYVAFVSDACDNVSPVSNRTAGSLNYHLGDVYDGATHGQGDNDVDIDDITELGAGYGTVDGHADYRDYLDVGPTHDMSTAGQPTTDNAIQFEDLIMFALNYSHVSKDQAPPAPASSNWISLQALTLPPVGESFDLTLRMAGNGQIQALSMPVLWNDQVVEYQGMAAGDLLTAQGGQNLILSPEPGLVDAALMGVRPLGICGEGVLATLTFRVLTDGDPAFASGEIVARTAQNEPVSLDGSVTGIVPSVTRLHANVPNPFNPQTTLSFDLARAGHVSLVIYALDGRRVRELVAADFTAGRFSATWDGRSDKGRQVASGVYLYRLVAPDMTQTRRMMLLK